MAGMTMKKIMIRPWDGGEHVERMGVCKDLHARLLQFHPDTDGQSARR
jgi:hypothetical protein